MQGVKSMILGDSTIQYLEKALNIASLRQDVIASNIANADTPNYRARHIPFKDILDLTSKEIELKITDVKHIKGAESLNNLTKKLPEDYLERNDKNNVNLDTEMTHLARNTILTNALTAFERYKFNQYKDIISSSRDI
jgi:flagellar basal-body rod protein FlgB